MGPADSATDTSPATSTDDFIAVRLQRRLSWVLPLSDQAVVREQARMVLPAHGPWLPDDASSLMLRNFSDSGACAGGRSGLVARLPHLQARAPMLQESATLIPWRPFWSSGGACTGSESM